MTATAPSRGRAGALALLAVAPLCSAFAAQQPELEPELLSLQEAYEVRGRLERHEDFRRAWIDARPELRERALSFAVSVRDPDLPPWSDPGHAALAEARYLLGGGTSASYPKLQRVADLLDLRPVPGAFAPPAADGKPTPFTVRVAPLDFTLPERNNRVRLFWVAPDQRETRARDEQVALAALQPPGFELYVHAPDAEEEGEWDEDAFETFSLYVEVRSGNDYGRSTPIRVPRVPRGLPVALAELAGPLAERARDAVELGLRPVPGYELEALAAGARGDTADLPATPFASETLEGPVVWKLARTPDDADVAVLLVTGLTLPAEAPLGGTRGDAWRDAARRADLCVLSTSPPLSRERTARIRAELEGLGVRRLVLVALGAAVPEATAMTPWVEGSGVDGLVLLSSPAPRERPPRVLPCPVLLVDALAERDAVELHEGVGGAGGRTTWIRRRELALTAELKLPALVADWVASELR